MRVKDRVLRNVAFVDIETNGSFTPLGTGFLVRVRINDAIGSSYLVTADHVVEMMRRYCVRAGKSPNRRRKWLRHY